MFVQLSRQLAKEIDYLHHVLLMNYPEWITKEPENKSPTHIINPETCMEIKKTVFISVNYIPGLSEEFRSTLHYSSVQVFFKGNNLLKSILMHPKHKVPLYLK